jgi:UDP-glucose 4-epimerase
MKIVVLGGSGFIGQKTCQKLLDDNHEVVSIDISHTHNRFTESFYETYGNICYLDTVDKLLDNKEFDCMFFFPAVTIVNEYKQNPEKGNELNIKGLTNALELCRKHNIKRFIFPSSVHVYSGLDSANETTRLPDETQRNIYSQSKLIGEQIVKMYSAVYGIDYTILRYGTAYGPNGHPSSVVMRFFESANKHWNIVVQGDDNGPTRSFLNVNDHASANVAVLNPICANQTYNIDGDEIVTMKELAEKIINLTDSISRVVNKPARANDYNGCRVDCSKIREHIGWVPSIKLDEGLAIMHKLK